MNSVQECEQRISELAERQTEIDRLLRQAYDDRKAFAFKAVMGDEEASIDIKRLSDGIKTLLIQSQVLNDALEVSEGELQKASQAQSREQQRERAKIIRKIAKDYEKKAATVDSILLDLADALSEVDKTGQELARASGLTGEIVSFQASSSEKMKYVLSYHGLAMRLGVEKVQKSQIYQFSDLAKRLHSQALRVAAKMEG